MPARSLDFLIACDSPEWCGPPQGFDWKAQFDEVKALKPVLEDHLNSPLAVVDPYQCQDGSAHSGLYICLDLPRLHPERSHMATLQLWGFTFSSFARLVTIFNGYKWPILPSEQVKAAIKSIERANFIFVSEQLLSYPYSGRYTDFFDMTWGDRFFSEVF